MGKIIKWGKSIINFLMFKASVFKYPILTERLGSEGCGWFIPRNFLNSNSVCYMAGAACDISFDVSVAEKYRCEVHIYNTVPVAKKAFDELEGAVWERNLDVLQGYSLCEEAFEYLSFSPSGFGKQESVVAFNHSGRMSRMISGNQTESALISDYYEAKIDRLSSVMASKKHSTIDLFKLNINGGEYDVIDSIIEDGVHLKCLCVRFGEFDNPQNAWWFYRIRKAIRLLVQYGYIVVDVDQNYSYTFLHKSEYTNLYKIKNGSE